MSKDLSNPYRELPSVERLLSDPQVLVKTKTLPKEVTLEVARKTINSARKIISSGKEPLTYEKIQKRLLSELNRIRKDTWPPEVINGTGVIIHTNLGRSPLSEEAQVSVKSVLQNYNALEIDLETGARGDRYNKISEIFNLLVGADQSLVVNNNASALMLSLASIAFGKEVIISRSESVEIGGGFRIPDVLNQSGAKLVEVGTTNRTYISDYEEAINENTGAILTVHLSNFKVIGFTSNPTPEEISTLGEKYDLPVIQDLGSGCILDTSKYGLSKEPTPQDSVESGIPITCFSGDKLLGGPQCGIISGTNNFISKIKTHPLTRALRVDKMTLAALHSTLLHYVNGEVEEKIPIWKMISMPLEKIEKRAYYLAKEIGEIAAVTDSFSTIGGGSLPGETIQSKSLRINCESINGGANSLSQHLRNAPTPVIGKIENEHILFDPRTVFVNQDEILLQSISYALKASQKNNESI